MAKAWLIRSEFDGGSVMDKFVKEGVISIDYGALSSLINLSTDEMKQELKDKYPTLNDRQVSMRVNTLVRMATDAQIGDFVIATDKEVVSFGKITSDYFYNAEKKPENLAHQRSVEWLKGPMNRTDVPDIIRMSLQAPISFSDISHLSDIIDSFLNGTMAPYQGKVTVKEKTGRPGRKPRPAKNDYESKQQVKEARVSRLARLSGAENIKEETASEPETAYVPAPAPVYTAATPAPVYAPAPAVGLKPFSYPIRFDQEVIIQLPGDITQQEAARLAEFVRTLYFK